MSISLDYNNHTHKYTHTHIYMKKIEKQSILNGLNLSMTVKSTLKRFGFIKPSPGLYDGEKIVQ